MDISNYRWGNRYFKSKEAMERAIKGLENAISISKEFKGVKGCAYVRDKKGNYRILPLKAAKMSEKAGKVEILFTASNIKELREKIEKKEHE